MSLQFLSGLSCCESPENGNLLLIAFVDTGQHFAFQLGLRCDTSIQALSHKGAEFDFGHIEPRAIGRRIMIGKVASELPRRFWIERLIKRPGLMGVQLVLDKPNALDVGIAREVHQRLHEFGVVDFGPVGTHLDTPNASEGFHGHQETTDAMTFIMMIRFVTFSRCHRNRDEGVPSQLAGTFIETDERIVRIIWLFIEIKKRFHAHQTSARDLAETPLAFLPGFEVVFFSHSWTVDLEIVVSVVNCTNRSARSRIVQR